MSRAVYFRRPTRPRLGATTFVRRRLGDPDTTGGISSEDDARNHLSAIGSRLQQANQALLQHESDVRALIFQSPGAVSPQTGNELLQLRQDFESMLDKYTTAYRAMYGTTPAGFSGLGTLGLEPVTLALIVTAIAAIGIALAIWWQHEQNVGAEIEVDKQKAQTQGTMANQLQPLQQQIAAAQARGDTTSAAALTAQYQNLLKTIGAVNPNPQGQFPWTTALLVAGVFGVTWVVLG